MDKETKHYRRIAIFLVSFDIGFIAVVLIAIGLRLLLR